MTLLRVVTKKSGDEKRPCESSPAWPPCYGRALAGQYFVVSLRHTDRHRTGGGTVVGGFQPVAESHSENDSVACGSALQGRVLIHLGVSTDVGFRPPGEFQIRRRRHA